MTGTRPPARSATGTGFEIVPLERAHRRAAIASVARAFFDDPLFNFFQPDLLRQHRALVPIMRSSLDDAIRHGEVWTAVRGGVPKAVAAWLPPGAYPRSAGREVRELLGSAAGFLHAGPRIPAALRLLRATERAHPRHEHWYLSLLAVDPELQGRGAGGRLLRPVLDRCDAAGLPAFVETQKEANVAWYGRSGFELCGVVEVRGAPRIWLLERPPRAFEEPGPLSP